MDRTADAQYCIAVFRPELIADARRAEAYAGLKRDHIGEDGVLHAVLRPEAFDLVRRTMDNLMEGSLDADLLNREAGFGLGSSFQFEHGDQDGVNAGLRHLLMLGWRCQRDGRSGAGAVVLHPAVSKALAVLGEGEWEGGMDRLANRCGVSAAYLSRVFRKQVGVPLSRYRNSTRLARFWAMQRGAEQRTIAEAVYAAGNGSYAQFYEVFYAAHGKVPRECLRQG